MTFERTLTVGTDRAAPNGELRLSELMRVLQDATVSLCEAYGVGYEAAAAMGCAWVVTKYRVEVSRMPRYLDEVRVRLRVLKPRHGVYPVAYDVTDRDGNTAVRAVGHWLLIDAETRKAAVIEPGKLPFDAEGDAVRPLLRIRPEGIVTRSRHRADYARCDMNGHMNNTRYFDLAESLIPSAYQLTHTLRSADVFYRSEIRMDAYFDAALYEDGDVYYLEGQGDEQLFLIRMEFEKTEETKHE